MHNGWCFVVKILTNIQVATSKVVLVPSLICNFIKNFNSLFFLRMKEFELTKHSLIWDGERIWSTKIFDMTECASFAQIFSLLLVLVTLCMQKYAAISYFTRSNLDANNKLKWNSIKRVRVLWTNWIPYSHSTLRYTKCVSWSIGYMCLRCTMPQTFLQNFHFHYNPINFHLLNSLALCNLCRAKAAPFSRAKRIKIFNLVCDVWLLHDEKWIILLCSFLDFYFSNLFLLLLSFTIS